MSLYQRLTNASNIATRARNSSVGITSADQVKSVLADIRRSEAELKEARALAAGLLRQVREIDAAAKRDRAITARSMAQRAKEADSWLKMAGEVVGV